MRPRFLLLLLSALLAPRGVAAQRSALVLQPANASVDEAFTRILSVRELTDGRVLVTDDRDNRLVVADMNAGTVASIGRVGGGPGEFAAAGRLVQLPMDSTLLLDPGHGARWLLLVGARIAATVPPTDVGLRAAGVSIYGADARGRVLSGRPLPGVRLPSGVQRGGAALLLVDRSTGRADTMATVRGEESLSRVSGAPERPVHMTYQVIFAAPEQAILFPDGWAAVVLQEPYRVDWHSPVGRTIHGSPLPWTIVRVTDREKTAWANRVRRQLGPNRTLNLQELPWAEVMAPYRDDSLLPMPDGSLLILRAQWSGASDTEYDVVNRRGTRTRTLQMPWNERIVGFGAGSVYVAAADADGVEHLRRHPWR